MDVTRFLKLKNANPVFANNPYTSTEKRDAEYKEGHCVRSITDNELLIEIDIEKGFDTPEIKQKLFDMQVKNFETIKKEGYEVYLFNHNGKCPHIRLYNIEGLNKQNQEKYFINFVQKYCEPNIEHTKYDKCFYGSFHWTPIEGCKHYKYGTIYQLEKNANEGAKNKVLDSLLVGVPTEAKRSIELDYLKILEKTDASEKERVSCVMQIFNKMKLNKDETMALITKFNRWSDFNPTITAQKLDYVWGYTQKENPLTIIREKIKRQGDWRSFCYELVDKYGIFYDDHQIWWVWDDCKKMWCIVDETDILNAVDEALDYAENTLKGNVKSEILEALRRAGRRLKPKPLGELDIQFKNKIINIKTLETYEATREYFAVNPIPWELCESTETPETDKLFDQWVGEEWKPLLYEICAFTLFPKYFIHRIFVLTGSGSNGKSKFLGLIRNLVGTHNHCSTELEQLIVSRFESVKLYKKLVCEMGETNFDKIKQTSRLKRLSGEDFVGFEFKNKKPFDDVNYAKILIATNTLPQTDDKTDGFYRRWVVVDFPNQFDEANGNVLNRIPEAEYSALCMKCIGILGKLMGSHSFSKEGSILDRRERYEKKSNPLKHFIEQTFTKNPNGKVALFMAFDRYINFLDDKKLRRITKDEFMKSLRDEGYDLDRESIKKADGSYAKWFYIYGLTANDGLDAEGKFNV